MDQLKKLLSSLTLRQKISLLVAAVAVIGGLYEVSKWNKERNFKPLYTGLASEDAGQIVQRLRENGVEYRLGDGGTSILVSAAQVAEVRLQMAAAGLPQSGRMGFELFDQTNFGATDFAEQVNYHRALEGELERSVMALAEVDRARVHIAKPKDSLFLESRKPAKASVMVRLRTGQKLKPPNVQAICYLVSSAVEGLEPEAVSVLDMRGNLLNRPRKRGGLDGSAPSDTLLEYRQQIERNLLAKIDSTLEPLLGADNFRAGVSVECDFTSGEQNEEIYDPEHSVMTTSQRTEDTSGSYVTAGGVPGTASSLPRGHSVAGKGNNGHSRRTENIAYQTSRTVRRTKIPQGEVKRISVSLLVDHEVRWEGAGEQAQRVVTPRGEDQLRAIRELVSGTVGLDTERGDQLIVESLPFESTRNWQPPNEEPAAPPAGMLSWPLPSWLQGYTQNHNVVILAAIGAVAGLLLIAVVATFFLRAKRRRKGQVKSVETTRSLPAGDSEATPESPEPGVATKMQERLAEQAAVKARLEEEALKSLKIPTVKTKKAEVLTKHISEEAQQDPVAMAQLVRTWLNEAE